MADLGGVVLAMAGLLLGWPGAGVAGAANENQVPLVDLLPGSSALFVNLDVGRMVADFDTLDLVRLYHDEEVQDFIRPAIEFLKQNHLGQARAVRFLLSSYGFPQVIRGRLTLALTGLGAVDGQGRIAWVDGDAVFSQEAAEQLAARTDSVIPDLVLRVETAGRESFESVVERLFELPPTSFATAVLEQDGFSYKSTSFEVPGSPLGALSIYHGFVGETFLAAVREERLLAIVAGLRKGACPQAALSDDPAFRAWRQSSVRGTEILEVYTGLGHALPSLMPFFREELEGLRTSGLDAVPGAGYALAVEDGRLRESVAAVLPEDRRGLLALLDALEPSGQLAQQIPVTAMAALALDLDPGRLFDRLARFLEQAAPGEFEALQRMLSRFRTAVGLDFREELLSVLGTRAVISASLPRGGWIPDVSGSVAIRDREGAQAALLALREVLERESGVGARIRQTTILDPDDAVYVSLTDTPMAPTVLLADDRLRVASSPGVLKRSLRRVSNPGRGEGPSEDLERCIASSVGQDRAGVSLLLYLDLARGVEFALTMSEMFLPAILAQAPFELDVGGMPLPETIAEYLSGALLTVRVSHRTLAVDFTSPVAGAILPLAVVSLFRLGS